MRAALLPFTLMLGSVIVCAESAAGLQWTAPAGWKNLGAQPMRAATYSVAPAAADIAGFEQLLASFQRAP